MQSSISLTPLRNALKSLEDILAQPINEYIRTLLTKYKNNYEFYAFGSRVKGTHKQYSDLDIAFIDKNNAGLTKIRNDLEESDLSITVDLIDVEKISAEFKKLIEKEMIKIELE